MVAQLLFCCLRRYFKSEKEKEPNVSEGDVELVYAPKAVVSEKGGMVLLEGAKRFEVKELLRTSVQMLGKGSYGTSYKAFLDDESVVAVKRLKDVEIGGRREFEQQMEVIGRFRHPDVVTLRVYYFAKEEVVHFLIQNVKEREERGEKEAFFNGQDQNEINGSD
ncbi:hypothetical protein RIF29_19948 [Crotalaria pallida]|uniref:Protein kinase domain-containing protein n=1 Tax=Crotalaria pallida TaxID=3830 RepID=A0AAN9IBW7_CROPI